MKTEIENFQSGFSGMPGVSQNHDGSPKRRLQPILLLDEPLGHVQFRNLHAAAGGFENTNRDRFRRNCSSHTDTHGHDDDGQDEV